MSMRGEGRGGVTEEMGVELGWCLGGVWWVVWCGAVVMNVHVVTDPWL